MSENLNSNLNKATKAHSEDYFGEYRDYWWNFDYLELVAKRLQLKTIKTALDVGCGVGHWGRLLSKVMSEDCHFDCIDFEEKSLAIARKHAQELGIDHRFNFQYGDACQLPFDENKFDLVTGQTILMHLADPKQGIKEVQRVLKPGGLFLFSEPNNFANQAIFDNLTDEWAIDDVIENLRYNLMIQRGKRNLKQGYNSLGDLIPGYLSELSFNNIQVWTSDKTAPFFKPYSTKEQAVLYSQIVEWSQNDFFGWNKEELQSYFFAGGGSQEQFEKFWSKSKKQTLSMLDAIKAGTYYSAGAQVLYLIAATK